MPKPKHIFIIMGFLFSLFIVYLYFNSLQEPEHIHSRDDAPQSSSDKSGELKNVIEDLEKQLQDNPENLAILINLGHVYMESQMYEKAVAIFTRAVKVDPRSAEANTDLGIALKNAGRVEEGLRYLEKATKEFPDYPEAWLQLGALYRFDLKQNRKALDSFKKFLALEKQSELVPRVQEEIKRIEQEMNP